MKFSVVSLLALAATVVSAIPTEEATNAALKSQVEEIADKVQGVEEQDTATDLSKCIDPLLCCGSLTTPLDPLVDPILLGLGINAAEIVGSIGLLCE